MNAVLEQALALVRAGYSILPVKRDGSKEPARPTWKSFQQVLLPEVTVRDWWGVSRPPGIAVVYGKVSGNAELLDFDEEATISFDRWQEDVEAEWPGLLQQLALIRSPSGMHAVLRCAAVRIPGNRVLARDPTKPKDRRVLIETRGEGGYALAPGCPPECHPTGRTYEPFGGVPLTRLAPITAEQYETIIRCAKALTREARVEPRPLGMGESQRPGDDFDGRGPDWAEILTPQGWSLAGQREGERRWRRPGKDGRGWSATTGYCRGSDKADLLRVFSSNADPFQEGRAYGKFRALTLLQYNGDWARCARELAKQGYGRPVRPRERRTKAEGRSCRGKAPEAEESSDSGVGATQVQRLTALAGAGDLFHDSQLQPWVAVPPTGSGEKVLVLPVSASGLGQWLRYRFWADDGGVPASGSVDDALKLLQAQAIYAGPPGEPNVRLAGLPGGKLALDLGDETYRCVLLTDEGWTVGPCPAARFWRPRGLKALPVPTRNGTLGPLWRAVNVGEVDRVLVAAWILGALHPGIAYPLLCLHGEEGSGKTSAARVIRQVIDPNACPLRAPPHGEENLLLACRHSRIVAVDNVSSLERGMPDSLCRVSTGAGLSRRSLFTDQEETCLSLRRPVLLNGIPEVATSSDLASRAITIECPPIRGEGRRTEEEIQREFEAGWPEVLGCLLDATVSALTRIPDSHRTPTGRMADWERWVDAGETALGFRQGTFAERWAAARRGSIFTVLEASPVAGVLLSWWKVQQVDEWTGSATDLLAELKRFAPKVTEARGFPANGMALSKALGRLAPSLRAAHLDVSKRPYSQSGKNFREVRLARST